MSKRFLLGQVLVCACAVWGTFLTVYSLAAEDFAVRRVTDLVNSNFGSRGTPLAVLNDALLFLAIENSRMGLYRTDGTNVELIDNSIAIATSSNALTSVESAQLGNELFFSAAGPDGRELYATDGQSVRQVANIAPGTLSSIPREFQILNGQLLFSGITEDPAVGGGAPIRSFHTDGTTVQEFPVTVFSTSSSALLGNRLFFDGFTPGGGPGGLYSTDGMSVTPIGLPPAQVPLPNPTNITRAGDHVFLVAGGVSERGIYRTDGVVSELVATFDSFTNTNSFFDTMFDLGGALYVKVDDIVSDEVHVYRTDGGPLAEVLRWQAPAFLPTTSLFDERPIFTDGNLAYFRFPVSIDNDALYVFDGTSFQSTDFEVPYLSEFEFTSLSGRVFLRAHSFLESSDLFEIINGDLVPLGPGLDSIALFQGELFGANSLLPDPIAPYTLWRTENGQLVSLGDVAGGIFNFGNPTVRFVEFDGRLYFNGANGSNQQLYAVVPVPESSMVVQLVCGVVCYILTSSPRRYGAVTCSSCL